MESGHVFQVMAVDMFPVLDVGATRVKQVRASIEA